MLDYEGGESGDELIRAIGGPRPSCKVVRWVKTESSVERLTRMSFSGVGAPLTKVTLARAATAKAKKRETNITDVVNSGGCGEALASMGVE